MKRTILKGAAFLALFAVSVTANAQTQATRLNIPYDNTTYDNHFGHSAVEYNGYSVIGGEFSQSIKVFHNGNFMFSASKPNVNAKFGSSLGMNQDWIAAGTPRWDLTPNDGNSNSEEGVVYLAKTLYGTPVNNFSTVISAQNPGTGDLYGTSVDLDGQWMVVGASQANVTGGTGFVEVWKQTSAGGWTRQHNFKPSNLPVGARFGYSVAIKGDYIVVGAPGAQKIYVYRLVNNVWTLVTEFKPNMPTWAGSRNEVTAYNPTTKQYVHNGEYYSSFGFDVDITYGNIIVGDPSQGIQKAMILALSGNQVTPSHTLLPPGYSETNFTFYGQFGYSVAIQYNRALVGAPFQTFAPNSVRPNEGKVYFYTDNYVFKGHLFTGTQANLTVRGMGTSVAIDSDNVLAGAAYSLDASLPNNAPPVYGAAFRMPFWQVYQNGNLRTTDVNDVELSDEVLSVYPNPSTGEFVSINTKEAITNAQAISTSGEVSTLTFSDNSISVKGLAKGVYILKVNTESKVLSEKLIIE